MSETKEQTPDIFKVGHRGAIELLDYQTPNRIDAYCMTIADLKTSEGIKMNASYYPPVVWALSNIFGEWRYAEIDKLHESLTDEEAEIAASEFYAKYHEDYIDQAEDVDRWLEQLTEEQIEYVSERLILWGSELPDGDDFSWVIEPISGQHLAFNWFYEGCYAEYSEKLGINIVEGDRPGSDYCAAELTLPIAQANEIAKEAGLGIRFVSDEEKS